MHFLQDMFQMTAIAQVSVSYVSIDSLSNVPTPLTVYCFFLFIHHTRSPQNRNPLLILVLFVFASRELF